MTTGGVLFSRGTASSRGAVGPANRSRVAIAIVVFPPGGELSFTTIASICVAANSSTQRHRLTQRERVAESAARLLEAAIELIAEQAFDRTTAAEIAERAGYSREMVRVRYGSKEALLESIFGSELDRRLLPAEDEDLTGLAWMLSRVDHVLGVLEDEPQLMRAFCVMSFEAAGPVPALRPWYSRWLAD